MGRTNKTVNKEPIYIALCKIKQASTKTTLPKKTKKTNERETKYKGQRSEKN